MNDSGINGRNSSVESLQDTNDRTIRFPFHGKSKYLLDKIYIIGYDYPTVKKILDKNDLIFNKKANSSNLDTSVKNRSLSRIYTKPIHSNSKENPSLQDYITEIPIKENPSLLNEIVNDYNKEVLDIDTTIETIFPNDLFYYSVKEMKKQHSPEKNPLKLKSFNSSSFKSTTLKDLDSLQEEINTMLEKKKYCVFFSSNNLQKGEKNKKSVNGFCYINFCKFKGKMKNDNILYSFYFPIALCFISEYPYYSSYYKLAEQIFNLFKNNNIEVPIEIMLHNIVNSTLSPIKGDIDLCIEPVSFFSNTIPNSNPESKKNVESYNQQDNVDVNENKHEKRTSSFTLADIDKDKEDNNNIIKEEDESDSASISKKFSSKTRNNLKKYSAVKETDVDKILRTKTMIGQIPTLKNLYQIIKFPFLQGYPLLQYNLPQILFKSFSISKLIYIFINSFLEKDILIFSDNIEDLSLLINSILNLNYPLNDNVYYNMNGCVSYNNYNNGDIKLYGSRINSIIGINSPFKKSYLYEKNTKIIDHIIYDLNEHEIYTPNKNDNNFLQFINKILKLKDDKEYKGSFLFYEIKTLHSTLKDIKDKYLNDEIIEKNDYDIFNYKKTINIEIQEAFYRFIVNILVYFYRQLKPQIVLDDSIQNNVNNQFIIDFEKNNNKINNIKYKNTDEENYFFNEFKSTFKFNLFFKDYINKHQSIDLYNISYLFFDEYLSILSRANEPNMMNNYNLKFFDIFEKIYNRENHIQKNNIDFNTFLSEYYKKYKQYFERDIADFNHEGRNIVKYSKAKNNLKYQWYELDTQLLLKYIYFIKSLDNNEYERMFNFNTTPNENVPEKLCINDIEDEIEKEIITNDFYNNGLLINDDDICCMNIILLIAISLKKIDIESCLSIDIKFLLCDFFLFRKYYYILMDMIYKTICYELYENKSNSNNLIRANKLLSFYYYSLNFFFEKNIIPNERIISLNLRMSQIKQEINTKIKENDKVNNETINDTYLEQKDKIDKNNYIIFVYHNFNYHKILKEKEIIKFINKDDKSNKNIWKNNLELIIGFKGKKINIKPKIKFIGKYSKNEKELYNISFESHIYSQRKIKDILNEEYQKYINSKMNYQSIDYGQIINSILNIFIYVKNSNKYKGRPEIIETIRIILYCHINSFIQ